jgi:hypothetical protein
VIHGVEILVGEVHGVGVESRELRVKSHCRSIKSVEPRDRKNYLRMAKVLVNILFSGKLLI